MEPSSLSIDPFNVAFWIGVIAPFIVSIALYFKWSSQVKFWVSLGVMVVLTLIAWWTTSYPLQWELVASQLAVMFTASQVVYRALKPTGILEWLEIRTSPKVTRTAKHAAISPEEDSEDTSADTLF